MNCYLSSCCGLKLETGAAIIASLNLLFCIFGLLQVITTENVPKAGSIYEKEQNLIIGYFILFTVINILVFFGIQSKKSWQLIMWPFFGLGPGIYLFSKISTNDLVDGPPWSNLEIVLSVLFIGLQIYTFLVMLSLYQSYYKREHPFATRNVRTTPSYIYGNTRRWNAYTTNSNPSYNSPLYHTDTINIPEVNSFWAPESTAPDCCDRTECHNSGDIGSYGGDCGGGDYGGGDCGGGDYGGGDCGGGDYGGDSGGCCNDD